MNRHLLISYAQAFVSFLFRTSRVKTADIKSIYLFGSVARGDFDENSDVDIFINTDRNKEKYMTKFSRIALGNFYKSDESKKFALMGIENTINIMSGDIAEWELFNSVRVEGVILYSSLMSPLFSKYFLVEMKTLKNTAKRNKIVRKLAGRKEKNRKERGLVEQLGGHVLDSRHYIIPAEKITEVTKIFSKENAVFEMREVWM